MIPLDDQLRPTWLFGQTLHENCNRGGYYEQADFADAYGSSRVHCQAGMLGAGRAVQRRAAGLDQRSGRLRQRRRHLYRLHDARISGQVHAVHGYAAGRAVVLRRRDDLRPSDSRVAKVYPGVHESRAGLADAARSLAWIPTRPWRVNIFGLIG